LSFSTFSIKSKPWQLVNSPRRVLAIRYQALGDVVITLPYLNSLKEKWPDLPIDFLTLEENIAIPKSLLIFDKVFSIGGGRNWKLQFILSVFITPRLWLNRYDVVLDLQNHRMSKLIRKILMPKAWCEFDKTSPNSAGNRNQMTIKSIGLGEVNINPRFATSISQSKTHSILNLSGWDGKSDLIVLNPAGFFSSRNWPIENYLQFIIEWLNIRPNSQFVFIGIERIKEKASYLKQRFGDRVIDLTNQTTIAEAFALLKKVTLVLTEDGGLMHMAWVQGIPTVALFGSSRADWSAPQGPWSVCLNSSDMECGPCMLEVCKFGDNRCLTRYSPTTVVERAKQLLSVNSN
jgi:heptosyltransferase II